MSGVYINGQKVYDLGRDRRAPSSSRRERIILVDSPPTPRTPPQTFEGPQTAPSSPAMPFGGYPSSPREHSSSRRPVIVDERQINSGRIDIEVLDPSRPSRPSRHTRQTSASSFDSRHSHTSDEEKQRRRQLREEKRQREEAEVREQKIRSRIERANSKIANRNAVPMAPAPPKRAATSTTTIKPALSTSPNRSPRPAGYARPHVVVHSDKDAELVEAVRRLSFEEQVREDKARKIEKKEARQEARQQEEAQRQRLKERMMPRRRATVGPGSRRPRESYDEGVFRWE